MSKRGFATPIVMTAMLAAGVLPAFGGKPGDDASKPEPAVSVSRAATRPASEDAPPVGAVQKALERLFTIPRPTTCPAGKSAADAKGVTDPGRLGWQHLDAIQDAASSVPVGGVTMQHRLGMQHADAIQHSASGVPKDGSISPVTDESALRPNGIGGATVAGYGYAYPPRRVPFNERDWINYSYYDGRPGRYGHALGDPYAGDPAGDVYRFGFNRGYHTGRFDRTGTERSERLLARSRGHLEQGLVDFHDGDYEAAARAFKLAAETNQGDPAARLYAAHALFATGRYRDAIGFLRRAFELQPKIAYLDFDIRDDYGRRADFDRHIEALENALQRAPRNLDRLTILGYVCYYTNQRDKAFDTLSKASRVDGRDPLVTRLLANCHPPDVVLDEMEKKRGDRD